MDRYRIHYRNGHRAEAFTLEGTPLDDKWLSQADSYAFFSLSDKKVTHYYFGHFGASAGKVGWHPLMRLPMRLEEIVFLESIRSLCPECEEPVIEDEDHRCWKRVMQGVSTGEESDYTYSQLIGADLQPGMEIIFGESWYRVLRISPRGEEVMAQIQSLDQTRGPERARFGNLDDVARRVLSEH